MPRKKKKYSEKRICCRCGNEFNATRANMKRCRECSQEIYRLTLEDTPRTTCITCGKPISAHRIAYNAKYCCFKCQAVANGVVNKFKARQETAVDRETGKEPTKPTPKHKPIGTPREEGFGNNQGLYSAWRAGLLSKERALELCKCN